MASNGWIKLHRQSVNNALYLEKPFDKWHAWQDILLSVCHEQKAFFSKGEKVTLEPGQMVTSIAILADRWGWSENKVRRFLGTLNGRGMSTSDGTPNGTLITVTNWAKYQDDGRAYGTPDGTPNGTPDGRLTRSKEYKKKQYADAMNESDLAFQRFLERQQAIEKELNKDDSK